MTGWLLRPGTLLSVLMVIALAALVACEDSSSASTSTEPVSTAARSPATVSAPAGTSTVAPAEGAPDSHAHPAPEGFPGGPTVEFTLTGLVDDERTFALADLQALPKTEVTTNARSGDGWMGEHTYGGPLLYDLIAAVDASVDEDVHNDLLRRAVVVTGSDGYEGAVAWGEIDPDFAAKQILVAYERDGEPLPEEDGFVRLIVPGDVFGGRHISNIMSIEVADAIPLQPQGERQVSMSLETAGTVDRPGEVDRAWLAALPQVTVGAISGGEPVEYTGPLLRDVLDQAGIQLDPENRNAMIMKGMVGVGADGYAVLVAGGEIAERFGNNEVIVAIDMDGAPLEDAGFARIVVPGDQRAGRYVSNLIRIVVVDL